MKDPYGDALSRAMTGHNPDAARELIEGLKTAALTGDMESPALRLFLANAAAGILDNIDHGRSPGADAA